MGGIAAQLIRLQKDGCSGQFFLTVNLDLRGDAKIAFLIK
jgi:hypothetical protein